MCDWSPGLVPGRSAGSVSVFSLLSPSWSVSGNALEAREVYSASPPLVSWIP